jgi:hypothetical protein
MAGPLKFFGIPLSKGKIRVTGQNGTVVSFNLRQIYLRRLLRAQLYSPDQKPLTPVIPPHVLVTDVFNYPIVNSPVDFACAQQEYTVFVFVNNQKLSLSKDLRVVFWFQRYPIPVKKDDDRVDVPDEAIQLLIAEVTKEYLLHTGKPVPAELEKEIVDETVKLKGMIHAGQNFWVSDTFSVSEKDSDSMVLDDDEIIAREKEETPRVAWTKSKSEFCQHVKSEYAKHPEEFSDLKDATFRLYKQHDFPFIWSKRKCYGLVRKMP